MGAISTAIRTLPRRRHADADVLRDALAGDDVAFAELYRRYRSRILGFLTAQLLDPGAAEDATQEVFLRVLRAKPAEDVRDPTAWLYRIARNVATDVYRARAARPRDAEALDPDGSADARWAPDSMSRVFAREDARTVFLALRRMRPRYRSALVLREIHGLSSAEMGEALGMSAGAVDTLVSRARDAFGVAYADAAGLPGECRTAVERMYRSLGTGITPAEEAALSSHIAGCPACRAERAKAIGESRLAALLPFLLPAAPGFAPFAKAVEVAAQSPDIVAAPVAHVPAVVKWMLAAVAVAGPVVGAGVVGDVVGRTHLRASPAQLRAFAAITDGDADGSAQRSRVAGWDGAHIAGDADVRERRDSHVSWLTEHEMVTICLAHAGGSYAGDYHADTAGHEIVTGESATRHWSGRSSADEGGGTGWSSEPSHTSTSGGDAWTPETHHDADGGAPLHQ